MQELLKIAVQKSGRLLDGSLSLLKECGIKISNGKNQLKVTARNYPLEVFYLRNSDIPQYVFDSVADIAILGQNTLMEKGMDLEEILPLGFSKCRLSIAVPKGVTYTGTQWLQGKRIATSYPHSLRQFLDKHNIKADIHIISGSVEIAPNIGLADAICDLISTGNTLFRNGLQEAEVIMKSEATLVARKGLSAEKQNLLDQLVFRFRSVLEAGTNKYVLLNAPNAAVDQIIEVLPGMKSPTVLPLANGDWSSIHTVISEERFWEIIDQLKALGAQGILVVPIEKMIL
ncbi:MAG: ATP phosphoribosyltransferase [Saprospiraceae bacterium]|nr:ATP phosphoribosyltransferase [Saprospiraceae bacterium]